MIPFFKKTAASGFTLIETMVAISILLVVLTGPLGAVTQSLHISYTARDEITASYLMQDGVEFLRNLRDADSLAGSPWLASLSQCQNQSCTIDTTRTGASIGIIGQNGQPNANVVPGCGDAFLEYDAITGLYQHGASASGNALTCSIYQRTFTVVPSATNPGNEAKILVTIAWNNGTISKTSVTTENIFNWQQ